MVNILVASLFACPLLAMIIHMLLPVSSVGARRFFQSIFVCVWVFVVATLFCTNSGIHIILMGSWPSPFGIALLSDKLSNLMLLVFAIIAFCINFYSYYDQGIVRKEKAFYAGFWLLLVGVSGAVLTSDLFNLYVWFEVILVSAFVLLASNLQRKPRAMMHYAMMNITGTLFLLLAIALVYGLLGSLSYAQIAEGLSHQNSSYVLPVLGLLLFAIGLKGAVFPLYFWLPKAYPKTSHSSTMLLSSLITKVVMVVILRLVWLWSPLHSSVMLSSLMFVALLTMFLGVIGAAGQFRLKDILSFHIVSQLGYILLAIVQPFGAGTVAAIYFLIHNVFVKTNLFMVSGVIEQQTGTDDLKQLGHLLKSNRFLSITFFLSAMSLAGFPPLSGFWAKFLVIKGALLSHEYFSGFVAILVSLFTLYSMIKIWRMVFCQGSSISHAPFKPISFSMGLYMALLPPLVIPICIGLFPDVLLGVLSQIAHQLSNPGLYIHMALGGGK